MTTFPTSCTTTPVPERFMISPLSVMVSVSDRRSIVSVKCPCSCSVSPVTAAQVQSLGTRAWPPTSLSSHVIFL